MPRSNDLATSTPESHCLSDYQDTLPPSDMSTDTSDGSLAQRGNRDSLSEGAGLIDRRYSDEAGVLWVGSARELPIAIAPMFAILQPVSDRAESRSATHRSETLDLLVSIRMIAFLG
jgi:hypothetical protein